MGITTVKWFLGAELNQARLRIVYGLPGKEVPIAQGLPGFMGSVTRIVLRIPNLNLNIDSANGNAAGVFDWTTELTESNLILYLGKFDTTGLTIPAGLYLARLDFYQGNDNAVVQHDLEYTFKVNVFPEAA